MDPDSVIFVSSDEDGGWDDPSEDSYDWLSELLDRVDKEKEESDDVVVVGETQGSKTSNGVKQACRDDLDDDCLILDGDPDNPVAVVNDAADGSDELLIVGEKGQLACRDYPHSRHMCAKFPFSLTPHEKYCDLCHCYVCDLRAPCIYWGNGVSTEDHCHSTDKVEIWRVKRKCLKQGKLELAPAQKLPNAISILPPLSNQHPVCIPLEPSKCRSVSTPSVSKSTPRHACSPMTSFEMPNIIGLRSNKRSGPILGRNRVSRHVNRSQLMHGSNDIISRERGRSVGTLGPQFVSPQMKFKRVGPVLSPSAINRPSVYGLSNNNDRVYTSQPPNNQHPLVMPNDDLDMWQNIFEGINSDVGICQSPPQPNIGNNVSDFQSYGISQPEVYSQPIPQSNEGQNLYQHENLAPNAANPNVSDFNFDWMSSTTQGIQHPPPESPQLQSVQPISDPPPPVTESNNQHIQNIDPGSPDFHIENWIFSLEHQTIPGITIDSVPSELMSSPQPASVDPTALLYDSESSWNGVAPV